MFTNIYNDIIDTSVICNASVHADESMREAGINPSLILLFGIKYLDGHYFVFIDDNTDCFCGVSEYSGDYATFDVTDFLDELENTKFEAYASFGQALDEYYKSKE